MMSLRRSLSLLLVVCLLVTTTKGRAEERSGLKLFESENLVAWCIVPFDGAKRGPEERAAMMARLGFTKFAYDYRAEHIPTFDQEMEALKRHHIELTAWWFPTTLNGEAKTILDVLQRHGIKTQLWVTGGGEGTKNESEQTARVKAEAARIKEIAVAAKAIGCTVGLYNHGGWFGEPENQLAVIDAVGMENVGIVYNMHHGHTHVGRFAELLKKMQPKLLCVNLNGMTSTRDVGTWKIMPVGQGEHDLELLKIVAKSGYQGPIGIIGHTQDDAELRLLDNLDGLAWLVRQMKGETVASAPLPRTAPALWPDFQAETVIAAEFDDAMVKRVLSGAKESGNSSRGATVFSGAKYACLSCHKVGALGGAVGPELTDVGKRMKPEEIVASVLWPKHAVKPEYLAWTVLTSDGRTRTGYKRKTTDESIELFDTTSREMVKIPVAEIEAEVEAGTLMPDGLMSSMTIKQRRDLVRFLLELGQTAGLENMVSMHAAPVALDLDRKPLEPARHPTWEAFVNRERMYDYYLKEAMHFREQTARPHLLPAYPDLDTGRYGHWGNQNEESWKDDRWSKIDLGRVLAGVIRTPDQKPTAKGVSVRLGENGELAACFDPTTLTYSAVWDSKETFIRVSDIRGGFMTGFETGGSLIDCDRGTKPEQPFVYHGYYRDGDRIVFSYRIGDVEMLDSPWVKDGQFVRNVAPASDHSMKHVLGGGAARWPETITLKGELGTQGPYAIDHIPIPFDNPWGALIFPGDHGFLPDGSAMITSMTGDVWLVTGIDATLEKVTWKRYASGLHQPLGMVVSEGQVYVLGRDQITRLHDLNHDGEADFYECFINTQPTSPGGHDYLCGLVRDKDGNFYTASSSHGLLKISADGKTVTTIATGVRNPDGIGILPDGALTIPSSEGDWVPASMVCLVKAGDASSPHFGHRGPKDGKSPELPLVYLPRGMDNSSGGQIFIDRADYGPLSNQLLHFSYGTGTWFMVLRDRVGDRDQGAIVPMPGEFRSGAHRGKVNPKDHQLYVSGMGSWGSYTVDDGCFQRVRYTGESMQLPVSYHVHANGVRVTFAKPIDPTIACDVKRQFAQAWNYRYSPAYGSAELSPSHPGTIAHDHMEISEVHVIDDRSVFVEIPELQPVNQLHLVLQVDDGAPQQMIATVHAMDGPYMAYRGYRPELKTIANHPLAFDLTLLGKSKPNPWRKAEGFDITSKLEIEPAENLRFSKRTLKAKAGEGVELVFKNVDVVPHNWVLVKPGSLPRVGDLSNKLIADPEAFIRHYVPETDDVLVFTNIVEPGQRTSVFFKVPSEPGVYPYLCTFPGHWMVMNGELVVE